MTTFANPSIAFGLPGDFLPHNPNNQHGLLTGTETNGRLKKAVCQVLEQHYQHQPKPSTSIKKQFADALRVPEDKIHNWFQNRRAKTKGDFRKYESARKSGHPLQLLNQTRLATSIPSRTGLSADAADRLERQTCARLAATVNPSMIPHHMHDPTQLQAIPMGVPMMNLDYHSDVHELTTEDVAHGHTYQSTPSSQQYESDVVYPSYEYQAPNMHSIDATAMMPGDMSSHEATPEFVPASINPPQLPLTHAQYPLAGLELWRSQELSMPPPLLLAHMDGLGLSSRVKMVSPAPATQESRPGLIIRNNSSTDDFNDGYTDYSNGSESFGSQGLGSIKFAKTAGLAARRQRPSPAALSMAGLRSVSFSQGLARSPGTGSTITPGSDQALRRIRSQANVTAGRIQKAALPQRSPMTANFTEAIASPKFMHQQHTAYQSSIPSPAASFSNSTLAPPTPVTPDPAQFATFANYAIPSPASGGNSFTFSPTTDAFGNMALSSPNMPLDHQQLAQLEHIQSVRQQQVRQPPPQSAPPVANVRFWESTTPTTAEPVPPLPRQDRLTYLRRPSLPGGAHDIPINVLTAGAEVFDPSAYAVGSTALSPNAVTSNTATEMRLPSAAPSSSLSSTSIPSSATVPNFSNPFLAPQQATFRHTEQQDAETLRQISMAFNGGCMMQDGLISPSSIPMHENGLDMAGMMDLSAFDFTDANQTVHAVA